VRNRQWESSLETLCSTLLVQTPSNIVIRKSGRKSSLVRADGNQGGRKFPVNRVGPGAKVVEGPLNPQIALAIVMFGIREICEIQIFYEVNRSKVSVAIVIILASDGEDELRDLPHSILVHSPDSPSNRSGRPPGGASDYRTKRPLNDG
jgi:hypothetical protein